MSSIASVILAAGEGKRLILNSPKALASVLGKSLIDFPLQASMDFFKEKNLQGKINIVTGHRREELESYLLEHYKDLIQGPSSFSSLSSSAFLSFSFQKERLGTADALKTYFTTCKDAKDYDYTLVLCADTPLIKKKDLTSLFDKLTKEKLDAVVATCEIEDPYGYGRIVRPLKKKVGFHIVEEKDLTAKETKIFEINSGVYIFKTSFILKHLFKIDSKNKAKEFYLTDLFQDSYKVSALKFESEESFLGVNTLEQLEKVGQILLKEKIGLLREKGVRFVDARTNYIDWDVEIGERSFLAPFSSLKGKTSVGQDVIIEEGCIIKDTKIEAKVHILAYSYLEKSHIGQKAKIGPFARLRVGTVIGEEVKIGNFVETKKASFGKNAKVSHLSYVGDAEVGENSNLGCGFITCNYDGHQKYKTKIGKDCFIGSDSQLVAPVEIGDRSFVASGSTITESLSEDSFAIARSRQVTKEGLGKKYTKK